MANRVRRSVHGRFAAAITAALIASGLVSFFSVPVTAAPSLKTLDIVGGTIDADHVLNSADPYTETSTDGGVTWRPAYLVGGNHPWGNVSGTNSWLNCRPSFFECLSATSLYRYRFWVPSDFTVPKIDGSMIMDNIGSVYLNGQTLISNQAANYSFPSGTSLSGKLQAGWNTLSVELIDQGGWAGINFKLIVSIVSEYSMTLASPGRLIMYDGTSGTASRSSDTLSSGDVIRDFPTGARTGYVLRGWYTAASGGVQRTASNASPYNPSGDESLYAQWDIANYNVIYDEQGGGSVLDDTYQMSGTVTLRVAPSRSGYTFDGWFDSQTGGTKFSATYSPPGTGDLTIYAQWTAIPSSGGSGGGSLPSPTPSPATSPPPSSAIEDGQVTAALSKLITTFDGDQYSLKPSMLKTLNKIVKISPAKSSFKCVGSTSGARVTAFDTLLAKARAKQVCGYLVSKVPGSTYSIALRPSSSKLVWARHVMVHIKFNF